MGNIERLYADAVKERDHWIEIARRTPCIIWQGAKNKKGYGVRTIAGKNYLAHRVAYERDFGPIPDGKELDHLCLTYSCVNTAHLQPVTHAENSRRATAILNPVKAQQIRDRHAAGESYNQLARAFGVSNSCINNVLNGRTWVAP